MLWDLSCSSGLREEIWAISTTGGTMERTKGFQQVCKPQQLSCVIPFSWLHCLYLFFFSFLSVCRTAFTQQTCPFKTGFLLIFTFYLVYLVDFTWLVNWWKISLFIDFSILNSKYSFVSFILCDEYHWLLECWSEKTLEHVTFGPKGIEIFTASIKLVVSVVRIYIVSHI